MRDPLGGGYRVVLRKRWPNDMATLARLHRTIARTLPICFAVIPAALMVGCRTAKPAESLPVQSRYWFESEGNEQAIEDLIDTLRLSIADNLLGVGLETGYPRHCKVIRTPVSAARFHHECVEDHDSPNALKLYSDGEFLEFVTLDFPSPKGFMFQVYLIPDLSVAESLSWEQLSMHPRVAIPHFFLVATNYRQVIEAVARGIEQVGAVTFAN